MHTHTYIHTYIHNVCARLALLRPPTMHRNRKNRAMAWTAQQLGLVNAIYSRSYSNGSGHRIYWVVSHYIEQVNMDHCTLDSAIKPLPSS